MERATRRLKNVWLALMTAPAPAVWLRCLFCYLGFVAFAATLGATTGFLKFELMSGTPGLFVIVPVLIMIRPALLEEIVFRGLFLPHPREGTSRNRLIAAAVFSLLIFVAMHPLNGMFVRHEARAVFTSPIFLSMAAVLGLVCTIAYQISESLWPPVVMHWLTVVIWTMFLGGKRMLTGT